MSLIISTITPNNSAIVIGADSRWGSTDLADIDKWSVIELGDDAQKIFPVAPNIAVTTNGSTGFSYWGKNGPESGIDVESILQDLAKKYTWKDLRRFIERLRRIITGEIDLKKELNILEEKMVKLLEEKKLKVIRLRKVLKDDDAYVRVSYSKNKRGKKDIWIERPDIDFTLTVNGFDYRRKRKASPVIMRLNFPENTVENVTDKRVNFEAAGSKYIEEFGSSQFPFPLDSQLYRHILFYRPLSNGDLWVSTTLSVLKKQIDELCQCKLETADKAVEVIESIIGKIALLERLEFKERQKDKYGSVPYVGGPIDLAVIDPVKGFYWVDVKRKIRERQAALGLNSNL